MIETIYISRHGFRSDFLNKAIRTSVTGTNRDPPDQAKELAKFYQNPKSLDGTPLPVPELLFSSPFYRCVQTASFSSETLKIPLRLEHGIAEWYSPTVPGTGIHPRPGGPDQLARYFPDGIVDKSYNSTVYPPRTGETMQELQGRCDLFINVWLRRIEEEYPDVKTVALFGHAASVIALGRSLTGNRSLEVKAGCASTSLYQRKQANRANTQPLSSDGVGQWNLIWDGRADYLTHGLERDWSFDNVVLDWDGRVVSDNGDGQHHTPEDEQPVGVSPECRKYLNELDAQPQPVYTQTPESNPQVKPSATGNQQQELGQSKM